MDLQHLFLDSGSHRLYGVTVFPKEASWCCWNKGFLISKYFRYMNYTSQMTAGHTLQARGSFVTRSRHLGSFDSGAAERCYFDVPMEMRHEELPDTVHNEFLIFCR